jgi:hypothetical protein
MAIIQRIACRLGYRQVKFAYTQPPLASGELPCFDLVLLVYRPDYEMSEGTVYSAILSLRQSCIIPP